MISPFYSQFRYPVRAFVGDLLAAISIMAGPFILTALCARLAGG